MKRRLYIALGLVAIVLVALGVILSRTILYFGPGLPQRDDAQAMRELQASIAGADPMDFRAIDLLYEIGEILGPPTGDDGQEALDLAALEGHEDLLDNLVTVRAIVNRWDVESMIHEDHQETFAARRVVWAELHRADQLSTAGDYESAMVSIERCVRLSQLFLDQPLIIMRLVGSAMLALTLDACMDVASRPETPPHAVDEMQRLLESVSIPGMDRVIDGEKIRTADTLRHALGGAPIRPINAGAQFAMYEEIAESARDWLTLSKRERIKDRFEYPELDWRYPVADILSPSWSQAAAANDQMLVHYAGARVMLAIESHRRSTGRYPAALDELPGPLPMDPFAPDGRFRYRTTDGGYSLYSVAYDGVDLGGAGDPDAPFFGLTRSGLDYVVHQVPSVDPSDSPPPP